jgi:hypothetical protein
MENDTPIAKNNGYPTNMIHNLITKLVTRKQKQQQENKIISHKNG